MNFPEMLISRRSVRDYQDKTIPLALIKEMIEESTLAPSAGNEQPWKFIIVNDKAMLKRMSDESKKNILARIEATPNDPANRYKDKLQNNDYNVFYNAPCMVAIIGPSDLKNVYVDCALAASYFMLAAASRHLGTCWINLGAIIKDKKMIQELAIPENHQIIAPIILGYPVAIPAIPKRKEPDIVKIINKTITH